MKTQEWQQSSLVRVTEEVDAGSGQAVVAVINCHIDRAVVALSSRSGLHATRGRIRTIFGSLRQGNDLQVRDTRLESNYFFLDLGHNYI